MAKRAGTSAEDIARRLDRKGPGVPTEDNVVVGEDSVVGIHGGVAGVYPVSRISYDGVSYRDGGSRTIPYDRVIVIKADGTALIGPCARRQR